RRGHRREGTARSAARSIGADWTGCGCRAHRRPWTISAHPREGGNPAKDAAKALAAPGPRLRGDERDLLHRMRFTGRTSKLHLRRLAYGLALLAEVEKLPRRKSERGCEQRRREALDASVVFLHGVVEEAAGRRDLVLDVGQLRLQLLEVGVGFEIRIGLRE